MTSAWNILGFSYHLQSDSRLNYAYHSFLFDRVLRSRALPAIYREVTQELAYNSLKSVACNWFKSTYKGETANIRGVDPPNDSPNENGPTFPSHDLESLQLQTSTLCILLLLHSPLELDCNFTLLSSFQSLSTFHLRLRNCPGAALVPSVHFDFVQYTELKAFKKKPSSQTKA
jgi:hypothetical protein